MTTYYEPLIIRHFKLGGRNLRPPSRESIRMSDEFEKIYHEALSLPADAKISLVERLLASLNLPTQADVDRLWAEEAERRVSQIGICV